LIEEIEQLKLVKAEYEK